MLGNAVATGITAPLSARLAVWHGARVVCAGGLELLAATFVVMATWTHTTPVAAIEVAMVALGVGVAVVIAPATESIMSVLPREHAGAGSAVNSTIRQLGGALGVAVLGSVLSTAYRSDITPALSGLPAPLQRSAGESIGATQVIAQAAADRLPDHGRLLLRAASDAFVGGMHVTTAVSAVALALAAAAVLTWMPRRRPAAGVAPRVYGFAVGCACSPVCPVQADHPAGSAQLCGCGRPAPHPKMEV